jgi:guanylate kinase
VTSDVGTVRQGLLVVVSGPSGVGKGTILERLLARRQDCVFSISATTRSPRPGEIDGKHYHFLSPELFNRWIEENRFLEWNQVHSAYYGTPRQFVNQTRARGLHVVLDIDVKGGLEVMTAEPDCVSIFLAPPDLEALRWRLKHRGTENAEQIAGRLLVARSELKHMDRYAYTIVNDRIELAEAQVEAVLDAEMARTSRVMADGQVQVLFRPDLDAAPAGFEG